jgi:beta-lactamase class A
VTRGELATAAIEASGTTLCRPDPFTQAHVAELDDRYPGKLITAHVYDTRTGCHYRLSHDNRQRTASVFKVMVMAGTLLEAQDDGRAVTTWEMSQLDPMITESANGPVRSLWNSFGAAPWYRNQGRVFGLDDTTVRGDDGSAWGLTTTSAADQVDLLRQVLLGDWGPLSAEYRAVAIDLMTDVAPSQTWGVTAGVPDNWTVAQKNGFAGITINSVGWVDEPGSSDGYLVAILSQGWPDHPSGIAAVERVNRWVAEAMTE